MKKRSGKKLTIKRETVFNLDLVRAGEDLNCWSAHSDCDWSGCAGCGADKPPAV